MLMISKTSPTLFAKMLSPDSSKRIRPYQASSKRIARETKPDNDQPVPSDLPNRSPVGQPDASGRTERRGTEWRSSACQAFGTPRAACWADGRIQKGCDLERTSSKGSLKH